MVNVRALAQASTAAARRKALVRFFASALVSVWAGCNFSPMAARTRDRELVALLQHRSLSHSCGDTRRAVAALFNAARGLLTAGNDADLQWATRFLARTQQVDGPL